MRGGSLWVCSASSFAKSIWIDSEAFIVGDIRPCFTDFGPEWCIAVTRFYCNTIKIYTPLLKHYYGKRRTKRGAPYLFVINASVIGWYAGTPMLFEWIAIRNL